MRRVALFSVVLAAALVHVGNVRADQPARDPDAAPPGPKSAIDIALEDQKARNFASACLALKKIYREDSRPSTLFLLAQCYDQWGRIATAAVLYEDYEAAFDKLPDDEQKAEADREEVASKRRAELEKRVPKVVLRVPAEAPGTTKVLRRAAEGGTLLPVALGIPLPIDPGEHTIVTQIPGRADAFTKFTLKEAENRIVEVSIPSPSAAGDPTRKPAPIQPVPTLTPSLDVGMSGRRIAAYTMGGIGILGVLGGFGAGAVTFAQKDLIAKNCLPTNQKLCNPTGVDAKNTAKTAGLASTILFPIGAVGLGVGAILYFTEPPPSKFGSTEPSFRWNVAAGPGSAGVEAEYRW